MAKTPSKPSSSSDPFGKADPVLPVPPQESPRKETGEQGPAPGDISTTINSTEPQGTPNPPSPEVVPNIPANPSPLAPASNEAINLDKALANASVRPRPDVDLIAEAKAKRKPLDLDDLSLDYRVELAIQAHETIGKAAGHIPDFHSLTENMQRAMLKVVGDIWIAAQKKVREFDE